MKPLGLRLPVFNRMMLVLYFFGILGIALTIPLLQGGSPLLVGSGAPSSILPGNNSSSPRAGSSDTDPGTVLPAPEATVNTATFPVPPLPPPVLPDPNLTAAVPAAGDILPAVTPPPVSFPADILPVGARYEFRDNNRKQVVSVGVRSYTVTTNFGYHYDDITVPDIIAVQAAPGHRFIIVGVIWDLIKVVGEGTRTTFVIPAPDSYRLVSRGVRYQPVDPDTYTDILQDAIIGFGTLLREESIDRNNPGEGILVFEVPDSVKPRDSYIELCPQNTVGITEPHSPAWNCPKDTIRWSLV